MAERHKRSYALRNCNCEVGCYIVRNILQEEGGWSACKLFDEID